MSDKDLEKEFDDTYTSYSSIWSTIHEEMKKDLNKSIGDQWDPKYKKYLLDQRREALSFNKMRRIVKAIAGYQRKNRLSLRVDAIGGADEAAAEILSATLMWNTQSCNGYHILSDAFEHGALMTGLNMIEIAIDYSDDIVNGDIVWLRKDYGAVMFDPGMRSMDMKDCDAIITRDMITETRLRQLLPSINPTDVKNAQVGTKFQTMHQNIKGRDGNPLYSYDRMWVQTQKQHTVLLDRTNGQGVIWPGDDQRLRDYFELQGIPPESVAVVKRTKPGTELRIFVNGMNVWKGKDPTGLDEYPWVPVFGFYTPEAEDVGLRVQGIVRCMRDPQDEVNKRRSKMLDIIDSQIMAGWIAKENAVKNKDQLYQSGQGKVIWISSDVAVPIDEVIKENRPADIPQGLFTLTQIMDKDIIEIPGFNNEMLGMPGAQDVEVAAILSKLRQAQGLTVLADLFDNLDLSQKILGNKTIKAIQKNYTPEKIFKITEKQPPPEFYKPDFGKYDCVPVEGLLTDTQRQHHYAQLMSMRKMGMTEISTSAIIAAWPLEGKSDLLKNIQATEQAKAQADAENQKLNQIQIQLNQSMMQANMAKVAERLTQAKENRSSSALDKVKTLKGLQEIDINNLSALVGILNQLKNIEPEDEGDELGA